MKKKKLKRAVTEYSGRIEGAKANYYWPVSFDLGPDGFVGIDQDADDEITRVLLSPVQFKALRDFVARYQ